MAGAYRFTTSRASVTVEGGAVVAARATVTVRDGVARARRNGATIAELAVAGEVVLVARNVWQITGTDGTVWRVERSCGCGGSS